MKRVLLLVLMISLSTMLIGCEIIGNLPVENPPTTEDPTAVTISEVLNGTLGSTYLVEATVVALSDEGLLISDDTGFIFIYQGTAPTQSVGDYVKVEGATALFGGAVQFISSTEITLINSGTYDEDRTPITLDGAGITDIISNFSAGALFEIEGTLSQNESDYILTVEGTDVLINLQSADDITGIADLVDETVILTGYVLFVSGTSTFTLDMIVDSMILKGIEGEVTFDTILDRTIEAGTQDVDWSSYITNAASTVSTVLTFNEDEDNVDYDTPGSYTVTVSATDDQQNSASQTFNVTVEDTTAPTFDTIANQTIGAGQYTDIDWTTYVTNIVENSDGTITITEEEDNVVYDTIGSYTVSILVTDESSNSGADMFTVEVVDPNTLPTFDTIPAQTIEAGTTDIDWTTYITNPASLISTSLSVSETADNIDYDTPGTYTVIVSVSDENSNTASQTFDVTVEDTTAPTFDTITDQTIEAGAYTTMDWSTYITNPVDNSDSALTNAEVSSDVDFDTPGTYTVVVSVTDASSNTGSQTFNVIVEDTTDPAFDTIENQLIEANEFTTVDWTTLILNAADNSDDTLELAEVEDNVLYDTPGDYLVIVSVTDGSDNQATQTFTVTVQDTVGLVTNMDFSDGDNGWGFNNGADGGGEGTFNVVNEEAVVQVNTPTWEHWGPRLQSSLITFEQGKTYEITFDVKADAPRPVGVQVGTLLPNDPWFVNFMPYFYPIYDVDTSWQTITFQFTMNNATGDGQVLFTLGTLPGGEGYDNLQTTVYFDNVYVQETTPLDDIEAPILFGVEDTQVLLGTLFDPAVGVSAYDLRDGDVTPDILITGDTIDVNTAGTYNVIYTVSDDAGNEKSVTRQVIVFGNLLTNGDFGDGQNTWGFNDGADGGGNGAWTVNDGVAVVEVITPTYEHWGPRLESEFITFEQGTTYQVTFDVRADHPRTIGLQIGELLANDPWFNDFIPFNTGLFDATTDWQTFTFEFTMNNPTNSFGQVLFIMGTLYGGEGFDHYSTNVYYDNIAVYEVEPQEDTVPPVITNVYDRYLQVGSEWDPLLDVYAFDLRDGDLTSSIALSGDVFDATTEGVYNITYTVTDAAGNVATRTARVEVVALSTIYDVNQGTIGDAFNVFGAVVALDQHGFLMTDGTDYIYVYQGQAVDAMIGQAVLVQGPSDQYYGAIQFDDTANVVLFNGYDQYGELRDPIVLTGSTITTYITEYAVGDFVQFNGTLSIDGNYIDVIMDGTDIVMSLRTADPSIDFTPYNGQEVTVSGYVVVFRPLTTQYLNLIVYNIELNELSEFTNGDFSNNDTGWGFNDGADGGGSGFFMVDNEEAMIVINQPTWEQWGPRLESGYYTFVEGTTYEISFDALADDPRSIGVQIGELLANEPWFIDYMPFNYQIFDIGDTGWQTYTFQFTMNLPTHPAQILFNFGTIVGGTGYDVYDTIVYIDNVTISEVTPGPDEQAPIVVAPYTYLFEVDSFTWDPMQDVYAYDLRDGDLTSQVVVTGDTVDPSTPGVYVVTYTVTDAAGNVTTHNTEVRVFALSTVAEVLAGTVGDSYNVEGVVAAIGSKGFLLYDETGYIYVYQGDAQIVLSIGQEVMVEGPTSLYGGEVQFTIAATTYAFDKSNQYTETRTPTVYDGAGIDVYTPNLIPGDLIEFSGTLTIDGSYVDITIPGTDIVGSLLIGLPAYDATLYAGRDVIVTGYAVYVSGTTTSYLTIIVHDMRLDVTNAVDNSDFSGGTTNWFFNDASSEGGSGTFEVTNEEAVVVVTEPSYNSWGPRLESNLITFEEGKTYQITFDAKALNPRVIGVQIGELLTSDPWFIDFMPFNYQTFYIGTSWETFTFQFTMNHTTSVNGQVLFNMGTFNDLDVSATTVYFDNVTVVETVPMPDNDAPFFVDFYSDIMIMGENPWDQMAMITAYDIQDGDLTSQVVVTGDVIIHTTEGIYTTTYTVTDSAGNTTTVTRNVEVRFPSTVQEVNAEGSDQYHIMVATVVAVGSNGILVTDGTDYIYVYQGEEVNVDVGQEVLISGNTSIYGGEMQFDSNTYIYPQEEYDLYTETRTPTVYDGAGIDTYITNLVVGDVIEFTGNLSISGDYVNVTIPGTSVVGSLHSTSSGFDFSIYDGQDVTVSGYALYVSGSSTSYLNIIVTDIQVVE